MLRAAEGLTAAQRQALIDKLPAADANGNLLATWMSKECSEKCWPAPKPADCATSQITAALHKFYRFCAACTVPEIHRLAETIERWQQPIIAVHHHRTGQRPQRGLQPASSHTSGASPAASGPRKPNAAGYAWPAPATR